MTDVISMAPLIANKGFASAIIRQASAASSMGSTSQFNDECDLSYRNNTNDKIIDPLERDAKDAIKEKNWFLKSLVIVPALSSIGVGVAAFLSSTLGGIIPILALSVACVVGSTVIVEEILRDDWNAVRQNVVGLQLQTLELRQEVGRRHELREHMSTKVFCGEMTRDRLKDLVRDEELDIAKIRKLIQRNRKVNKAKRYYLRRDVQAEIVRYAMASDSNESGSLDQKQRQKFIAKLKTLPSVKINESKLLAMMSKREKVWDILEMIKRIKPDTKLSEKQPIVIDLESNELSTHIEEKAKWRESAIQISHQIKRHSRLSSVNISAVAQASSMNSPRKSKSSLAVIAGVAPSMERTNANSPAKSKSSVASTSIHSTSSSKSGTRKKKKKKKHQSSESKRKKKGETAVVDEEIEHIGRHLSTHKRERRDGERSSKRSTTKPRKRSSSIGNPMKGDSPNKSKQDISEGGRGDATSYRQQQRRPERSPARSNSTIDTKSMKRSSSMGAINSLQDTNDDSEDTSTSGSGSGSGNQSSERKKFGHRLKNVLESNNSNGGSNPPNFNSSKL